MGSFNTNIAWNRGAKQRKAPQKKTNVTYWNYLRSKEGARDMIQQVIRNRSKRFPAKFTVVRSMAPFNQRMLQLILETPKNLSPSFVFWFSSNLNFWILKTLTKVRKIDKEKTYATCSLSCSKIARKNFTITLLEPCLSSTLIKFRRGA